MADCALERWSLAAPDRPDLVRALFLTFGIDSILAKTPWSGAVGQALSPVDAERQFGRLSPTPVFLLTRFKKIYFSSYH